MTMQVPTARMVISRPFLARPHAEACREKPRLKIRVAAPATPRTESTGRKKRFRETSNAVRQPRAIASMPPRQEYSRQISLLCARVVRANGPSTTKTRRRAMSSFPRPNTANRREEEVEHLFYREGPQDVPTAGEVSAASLQDIDLEGERGEERSAKAACLWHEHEMFYVRQM